MKIMLLSVAVGFTVAMAGCASKPQINNSSRYAMALTITQFVQVIL